MSMQGYIQEQLKLAIQNFHSIMPQLTLVEQGHNDICELCKEKPQFWVFLHPKLNEKPTAPEQYLCTFCLAYKCEWAVTNKEKLKESFGHFAKAQPKGFVNEEGQIVDLMGLRSILAFLIQQGLLIESMREKMKIVAKEAAKAKPGTTILGPDGRNWVTPEPKKIQ